MPAFIKLMRLQRSVFLFFSICICLCQVHTCSSSLLEQATNLPTATQQRQQKQHSAASADPSKKNHPAPAPAPALAPERSTISSSRPTTKSVSSSSSESPLDPRQAAALQTLGVMATAKEDPCSTSQSLSSSVAVVSCDAAKPVRHVVALQMEYCSATENQLTEDAMDALYTLQSLSLIECPVTPVRLPERLLQSLTSFTCIRSLGSTPSNPLVPPLSAAWLARMHNLTQLTVTDVAVNVSGSTRFWGIVSNMKHIRQISISRTNVSGFFPKTWQWHPNVTSIDFSGNNLQGPLPSSALQRLRHAHLRSLDVSGNQLLGPIPWAIGSLAHLRKLSLANNSFWGPIPTALSDLADLVFLDLSGNRLNGSVPEFLSQLPNLRYLNLQNNDLEGPVPFNASFIQCLSSFNIAGNVNVCYNRSAFPAKLRLGVPACDASGFPVTSSSSNAAAPHTSTSYDSGDDGDSGAATDHNQHADAGAGGGHGHSGPNKLVVGILIALASIIVLIIVCICLAKFYVRRD